MAEQFECCTGRSSLLAAGSVIRVCLVVLLRVCIESGCGAAAPSRRRRAVAPGGAHPIRGMRDAGRVDRYFKSVSWSVYRDMTESERREREDITAA